jgi:hypothetical protein
MRQLLVVCLVALALQPAAADELTGTRGEVIERVHQVDVVLHPGHATLTVRRTVENRGVRHDQALLHLDLPPELIATGLRTLGTAHGQPRWFPGVLMEAEEAAQKYERLTGVGGYYPKDPALLSWRAKGSLMLQVFPVPPADRKTVEYTLTAPTEYVDGRHVLRLPRLGISEVTPALRVHGGGAGEQLLVAGRPFPSGGAVDWSWGDGDETKLTIDLALARAHAPVLDGRVAQKSIGPGRVLLRYQIEAAARVAEAPAHAQVVVVLDGSRSLDEGQRRASLAAAGAYLGHFDQAEVQVLTFARQVTAAFSQFQPQVRAREDLAGLALSPANGSQLDEALAEADRLLASRPAGARRVLLLTDLLTRSALTPEKSRRLLAKSGALLHIGVVDEGEPRLEVRDDDPWALVARATGGLVWSAEAKSDADARRLRQVFEEWARPVRLHRFHVGAPRRHDDDASDPPATLDEGKAFSYLGLVGWEAPAIEARGELWARPVRVSLRPDATETRVWSALVFGTELSDELSGREMMVLARHGGAVSPVTSYLAIEPGVRPSTEGLEEGQQGASSYSRGYAGGLGEGAAAAPSTFDHRAFLRDAAQTAWRSCGGDGAVEVAIETTLVEIAEVTVRGARILEAGACLREALWQLELPAPFHDRWKEWTIRL